MDTGFNKRPSPVLFHTSGLIEALKLLFILINLLLSFQFTGPPLTFIIHQILLSSNSLCTSLKRMERVAMKRRSSQAKVLGTIISIAGAFVVTLYKGPPIIIASSPSISLDQSLQSPHPNWILGGIFLTAEYILVPLWYIVQTQIMKEYPAELTVVFFYNLSVSIIAAILALVTQGASSAWMVRPSIALASIVCSGLFGSCLNNTVHTWALHLKGPVFVAMFKPLSIAIAVAMGAMFLCDTLHLGSLIGAMIISIGFYTVMWGKAKEELSEDYGVSTLESQPAQKVPLLQSYKDELV